jgi:ankyrin repeat protein
VDDGSSPLLVAVWNGHFELAAELLKAGADPNADLPGYTALHALTRVRKSGVGDNDPSPEGSGAVTSLELVRQLKAHGADLNRPMTRRRNLNNTNFNEIGASPFLLAALTADAPFMRVLAELGADPLLSNKEGSTPLMAAAGLGTRSPGEDAGTDAEVLEAVQTALDLGADVNAVNSAGETAMHGAAYKNLPRVAEFLATKGASISVWNRKNELGWTPLTIARGYRIGNFKPSPETVTAIEDLMRAAGVTPPTEQEEQAKGYDIYAPKKTVTPRP